MPKKKTKYSIVADSLIEALDSVEHAARIYAGNPDSISGREKLIGTLNAAVCTLADARKALNGEQA
jgi:hypothetical protein